MLRAEEDSELAGSTMTRGSRSTPRSTWSSSAVIHTQLTPTSLPTPTPDARRPPCSFPMPPPSADDIHDTVPNDSSPNDPPQPSKPHAPPDVQEHLQSSLSDMERSGGLAGWFATKFLSAGDWIERELDERRQTIGGIDNLFLLLTDATDFNPVCACMYTLKGKLSLVDLRHAVSRLQYKYPKYCQRVTSVGRKFHGVRFEDDPDFDINNHVSTVRLPEPAGKRELDDLMGQFIARDWDLTKPLWEMVLVENYNDEEGAECAIISRGHHTLADGQGFVISQLYMTSYHEELMQAMSKGASFMREHRRARIVPSKVHPLLRPLDRFANPAHHVFLAPLIHLSLLSLFWTAYAWTFGFSLVLSAYQASIQMLMFALTCWRVDMLTGSQAPYTSTRVKSREFSRSKTVSLDDVRLCQQAFSGKWPGSAVNEPGGRSKVGHVTVNDVMCAVVADVCGEEVERRIRREKEPGIRGTVKAALRRVLPSPIGFFIPISIRRPGDFSMRNLSTASLVYLHPSPPPSPRTAPAQALHSHIHAARSSLSLLKHSLLPTFFFYLTQLTAGQAPVLWPLPFLMVKGSWNVAREWVIMPLVNGVMQSFAVLLTNVPGPAKKRVTLEGVEVLTWTALPPQSGKGTVGMGIISYANGLCISIAADRVPSPEGEGVARRICERFERRFEEYVAVAREVVRTQKQQQQLKAGAGEDELKTEGRGDVEMRYQLVDRTRRGA
ncbi:wax ester synthase-like acyl-CoA acyltransferase domain-containing protein [Cristinia sonorae]|uniref:Wax ester synthase-like acyl-CoA acyltransferase domain-containing protein n=1 Tax=Cristinia sonorae TaxID=1940300 RepID=A0A8K0UDS0_9AGAR|nr:wax ester synthase-like acyl-CoA acyltransferase domain-containing protein [Cristinia sonorae]